MAVYSTGVYSRGNSIIIDFSFNGQRCKESLRIRPTVKSIQEAVRKREAILHDIAMQNFEYEKYFPYSKKALKFSKKPGNIITIEKALKDWLRKKERTCAYSTSKDYSSAIHFHLIPTFGKVMLTALTKNQVENWIESLNISNKRINNILSPLRQVFKDAYCDSLIKDDPLSRVRFLSVKHREPKPFNQEEISKILNHLTGQEKNLIQFAFWSGLRTSELIGLRWEDIDLENDRFYVRQAVVKGRIKETKTSAGTRTVELNYQSREALLSQKSYAEGSERVFHDPKTERPWKNDQIIRKRVWIPALKILNVELRNPYQTRHTFASTMLSYGKNPLWVAQQMGHKDWGMIIKHYGRWIQQDKT